MSLNGTITALITPFANDEVNIQGLVKNVKFQLDAGIDGLLVLGSTGEDSTLNENEQEKIIQTVIQETSKQVPVIVNVTHASTQASISRAVHAEKQGADFLLIAAPYFNKPTPEGIFRHFEAICNSTSLPIIVYNIMSRSGVNIDITTLKRLAGLPNVCGVKEASGNIQQIGDVIHQLAYQQSDFVVLSGDDALTFPLMALGGHGVISVVSNLLPKEVSAMVNAIAKNDLAAAREKHYELLELFHLAFIESNPIPIKAAMDYFDLPAGPCRLPLCELRPENMKKLINYLAKCEVRI